MNVTLITGASSGIGEEFARQLARRGHNLLLIARSENKLHSLCDELSEKYGIEAQFIAADLLKAGERERVLGETSNRGLVVDVLINNAGFGSAGDFAKLKIERELEMIGLNVVALVDLTHSFLVPMRECRSGAIINVSSAAGFQPLPFMATYAATKAFVTSFTEAIAEENRPYGIHVMAFCPGSTKTNFFEASNIDKPVQVKGQHTATEAVTAALAALDSRRTVTVPGFANKVGAWLGKYVPTGVSRRFVGNALRSRYQTNK